MVIPFSSNDKRYFNKYCYSSPFAIYDLRLVKPDHSVLAQWLWHCQISVSYFESPLDHSQIFNSIFFKQKIELKENYYKFQSKEIAVWDSGRPAYMSMSNVYSLQNFINCTVFSNLKMNWHGVRCSYMEFRVIWVIFEMMQTKNAYTSQCHHIHGIKDIFMILKFCLDVEFEGANSVYFRNVNINQLYNRIELYNMWLFATSDQIINTCINWFVDLARFSSPENNLHPFIT